MSLNINDAPKPSGSFGIAKAGTQMARLVGIVSLGKQKREFRGEAKDSAVQINFTFELPNDKITTEEGEELPRWISMNRVTFSNNDKSKLTSIIKALDANDTCKGDLKAMVNLPCFLSIEHIERKGKDDFAKVTTITGVPEGVEVPELVNPTQVFDFYEPDKAVFDELPMWLQDVIKEAEDYEGSDTQKILEAEAEVEEDTAGDDTPEADRPY